MSSISLFYNTGAEERGKQQLYIHIEIALIMRWRQDCQYEVYYYQRLDQYLEGEGGTSAGRMGIKEDTKVGNENCYLVFGEAIGACAVFSNSNSHWHLLLISRKEVTVVHVYIFGEYGGVLDS